MPRKKKEQVEVKGSHFVYCDNRQCQNFMCLRRHENAPWNVIIHESRFPLNKDGSCDYIRED